MPATVDTPNPAYTAMQDTWDLLHDLIGGTAAMREAGEKWLPREAREQALNYKRRLERSFLYAAYRDTVKKLSSKPFARPITLSEDLPERLNAIVDDVDGAGRNVTQFGRTVFRALCTYGVTHILVDYPQVPVRPTREQEAKQKLRPRLVHVPPPRLIAWRHSKETGDLEEVRITETKDEPDGDWGVTSVQYVRVYRRATWHLYRQTNDGKEYALVEEGTHTFGEVPFVTIYAEDQTVPMLAEPPLEELAWVNLEHYQSSSDQRRNLSFGRVGILFAKGLGEEQAEKGLAIGPNEMIATDEPNAELKYVEHSGHALAAGERDLQRLEERMEVLGLQPLIQRSGTETATGRALNESRMQAVIHAWIQATELGLFDAFTMAGKWVAVELPKDFSVKIFSDFGLSPKTGEDLSELREAKKLQLISHETYLNEIKRRALIDEAIDVQDEIRRITSEMPEMEGANEDDYDTGEDEDEDEDDEDVIEDDVE